jgi:hypothetical protein
MSQQTSFDTLDAKVLNTHLNQFREVIIREWGNVSSQWRSLHMTWQDEQSVRFEPIFNKLLQTYAEAQGATEKYIRFLDNQIQIAEKRAQKLSGL